ncbi:hypothetical protein GGI25_004690 [Coemansia spiralis]|uniref:6,7-dimethyl-8-ribityllumazine synthase n=2 Tax=Coemansia TaxID=4863 RepID=A0A9W8G610_9FUNG|nr:hypothetical protein BX070DRAFT_235461 [Coemansia spiralis]KAJ1989761.1 hypothetical protein EDC05_004461 [Coemansia umbellata]KAJ2621367.1 hypothetical protein GGI26_004149 [Coemansia sp. RSA 1358]KAJ2673428.1 hypothetical protein GGI25_004690 [Coemansia spiralis]
MTRESPAERTKLPLRRRAFEPPKWTTQPRIGIVYSVENFDIASGLVNDLRYELVDAYGLSPISIKITQAECVHDIPIYIGHMHQRCDLVFALGVVFRDDPLFEDRLMNLLTKRLVVPARLVFDCVVVRDSRDRFVRDNAELGPAGFAQLWARRAMDLFVMLAKPAA